MDKKTILIISGPRRWQKFIGERSFKEREIYPCKEQYYQETAKFPQKVINIILYQSNSL